MKIYANDNFSKVRLINGYSIAELARQTGISKQQLGQVEKGINGISPAKAKIVIELLGVQFDEVFKFLERGAK